MAIYIGTKRIDGGGSSQNDPSIVRVYYPDNIDVSIFDASKLNDSTYAYNLPICSSINYISPIGIFKNDYSPIGKVIVNSYFDSYQFIYASQNDLNQNDFSSTDREFPGGISIYKTYGAMFSSETGFLGDSLLKIYPNWESGSIFCELTDGIHNINNSSDCEPGFNCYYSDCYKGELQPLLYTSKFDTGEAIGYPNTILDLSDKDLSGGFDINIGESGGNGSFEKGVSTVIVRQNSDITFNTNDFEGRTIKYASNINDLGIGPGGDPSTLVCYSILALDKYYLINAAIYK